MRGERDGCREADRGRDPAGEEADRGLVDARQEVVFAARPREGRRQLGVGQGAAQRDDAAHHPQHQQREARRDGLNLEAEAREHADADHVGDRDGGRGDHGHGWRVQAAPAVDFGIPEASSMAPAGAA